MPGKRGITLKVRCITFVALIALRLTGVYAAEAARDALKEAFEKPPESARPLVWWHWMNGNVSQEGIDLDLQWMQRVGIGGVHTFDASLKTPRITQDRATFLSPRWKALFRHAVNRAKELRLEFGISSTPGWSASGGPWVKPEAAMKKVVWSTTSVTEGQHFNGRLPQPPDVAGPFQNSPWIDPIYENDDGPRDPPHLYKDVAVVAYRKPDGDYSMRELNPKVTSSAGPVDARVLSDGDFTTTASLPFASNGNSAWVQLDFGRVLEVRAMTLALLENGDFVAPYVAAELQSSRDGLNFSRIAEVQSTKDVVQTISLPRTDGRYFRLLIPTPPPPVVPTGFETFVRPVQTEHKLAEFVLYTTERLDHYERKAGFFMDGRLDFAAAGRKESTAHTPGEQVIDLTDRIGRDGVLHWVVPQGHWEILRFGYSLTGATNHPASPEATGLEVDKLNETFVGQYFSKYLQTYDAALNEARLTLDSMMCDSWEAGAENWTDALPAEFLRRRGYELTLWLPALAGRIVVSKEATERFLWDFRRTLGELVTEHYFGQVARIIHARHMLVYGESHEIGQAFIGDGMDAKRYSDVPMGAMWANDQFTSRSQGDADLRESASVAHIYGQNIVGAESMTVVGLAGTAFAFAPEDLKPTADRELADGVNRFVLHTSVHQPLTKVGPGITLGPFGQWLTRNETWAEQASAFLTYMTRSSYLLQQGKFVADILYFYGEDANITALYSMRLPSIPKGFSFDFANPDVLKRLSVSKRHLETNTGMRYRVLVIDPRVRLMSVDVLQELHRLVTNGATLLGRRPIASPSRVDSEAEFTRLVDAIWGSGLEREHPLGRGMTFSVASVSEVLSALKIEPDFSYSKPTPSTELSYVHRHLEDGELYFVCNRQKRNEKLEASFRVKGKAPEIWRADSGAIERVSYQQTRSRTVLPLDLAPYDAIFVVFRENTVERARRVPTPSRAMLWKVKGPWNVKFQPGRGTPHQSVFSKLSSWTDNPDSGIRYYSGTATYDTTFEASEKWTTGKNRVEIDLGRVRCVADVILNGQPVGIAWKAPFRLDITDQLRPGVNHLSVRVTNLWPNRLIGDKQPENDPVAFTTSNPYGRNSPLLESGLLGPVILTRISVPESGR